MALLGGGTLFENRTRAFLETVEHGSCQQKALSKCLLNEGMRNPETGWGRWVCRELSCGRHSELSRIPIYRFLASFLEKNVFTLLSNLILTTLFWALNIASKLKKKSYEIFPLANLYSYICEIREITQIQSVSKNFRILNIWYNPKCNLLINGGILAILVEKGMDNLCFSHLFEIFTPKCEARRDHQEQFSLNFNMINSWKDCQCSH